MLRQEECLEEDARPAAGAEGQKSGQLEQDWGDGGHGGFWNCSTCHADMMHLQSGSNVALVPVCFWLQAGGGRGGRGRGWSGWRALLPSAGPPWPTSQAAPSAGVCRCFIEPVAI